MKSLLTRTRVERGISVEELAMKIGVSGAAIYKWESGKRAPSFKNMVKISKILNKTVDELFLKTN